MPTDAEWEGAFERIDGGESSYRDEARKLGVNPATVLRHYLKRLELRVGLLREERAELEGDVASIREKLDGLSERYARKDQELAGEYGRKRRAAEAEFQGALESLRARMAGEEARLRESLAREEQEGKRRLGRIDAEVEAKNAMIAEFKKRGLEPARGLELLKEHEDLCGEISRRKELLKRVNSDIEEGKRRRLEEERKGKKATEKWDEAIRARIRRKDELDAQIGEMEGLERRLKEGLKHRVGAEFFKALHRLKPEDRLAILRYGIASCTPHEAETLYCDDVNRRMQDEILKIRQEIIRDLVAGLQ